MLSMASNAVSVNSDALVEDISISGLAEASGEVVSKRARDRAS